MYGKFNMLLIIAEQNVALWWQLASRVTEWEALKRPMIQFHGDSSVVFSFTISPDS